MFLDKFRYNAHNVLSLPELDQIETLQSADDVVVCESSHGAQFLHTECPARLFENLQQNVRPVRAVAKTKLGLRVAFSFSWELGLGYTCH